jgi:formylglycine-generating enzyme required for sulfatase activity
MVMVSWELCQEFLASLNQMTGQEFSLPSEAEWEYACRAGSTSQFYFGDDDDGLGAYAWFRDNSDQRIQQVGGKTPNLWGLYDMHGNVWEWCEDVYHPTYKDAPTDGSAWLTGGGPWFRVVRGGPCTAAAVDCRSAVRSKENKGPRWFTVGFRVVLRDFKETEE